MQPYANILAGLIVTAILVYILTGGTDLGAGLWTLVARGPRGKARRDAVHETLSPVWEANHVWLVAIVVILFIAFPLAFTAVMTALHIPLVLLLIGIIFRGAAFAIRSFGAQTEGGKERADLLFAVASVFTIFMGGVILGAVASGTIRYDLANHCVSTDYVSSWLAPFPLAVGLFALAHTAYLASLQLLFETKGTGTQVEFRRGGILVGLIAGALVLLCLLLAKKGAPLLYVNLVGANRPEGILHLSIAATALAALFFLWRRVDRAGLIFALIQTLLMVVSYAAAQWPYLVPPDLHIQNSAASPFMLKPLTFALLIGLAFTLPLIGFLYWVFKRKKG